MNFQECSTQRLLLLQDTLSHVIVRVPVSGNFLDNAEILMSKTVLLLLQNVRGLARMMKVSGNPFTT